MSGVYDTNVSEEGCITPDSTLGIHIDKYINHQIMAKMMKLYTELKIIYVLRLREMFIEFSREIIIRCVFLCYSLKLPSNLTPKLLHS